MTHLLVMSFDDAEEAAAFQLAHPHPTPGRTRLLRADEVRLAPIPPKHCDEWEIYLSLAEGEWRWEGAAFSVEAAENAVESLLHLHPTCHVKVVHTRRSWRSS